jgi:hypothetical protein
LDADPPSDRDARRTTHRYAWSNAHAVFHADPAADSDVPANGYADAPGYALRLVLHPRCDVAGISVWL